MLSKKSDDQLKKIARSACEKKHPHYYDSLICVGPGSSRGFGPPCSGCLAEVRRKYRAEQRKTQRETLVTKTKTRKKK